MVLTVSYDPDVRETYTKKVFQYTEDVAINLVGMAVPVPVIFDISNDKEQGNSVRYKANSMPIGIPNSFFLNGKFVYVWIYGENDIHTVVIPVMPKSVAVEGGGGESGEAYYYYPEEENIVFTNDLNDAVQHSMENEGGS